MPNESNETAIMPYLYYPDADEAFDFLVAAFGFDVQSEVRGDDGALWTAQLRHGDGVVLIGPALEAFGTASVADASVATNRTHVYVDDVQAHHDRAVAAGATIVAELQDHFHARIYIAADCGGQQWIFATPIDHRGG